MMCYYSIVEKAKEENTFVFLLFNLEWGGNVNLRTTAFKLQKALLTKGRIIKINQIQTYSQIKEGMYTQYVITERKQLTGGKASDIPLLKTYSMVEVIQLLAGFYNDIICSQGGGENEK